MWPFSGRKTSDTAPEPKVRDFGLQLARVRRMETDRRNRERQAQLDRLESLEMEARIRALEEELGEDQDQEPESDDPEDMFDSILSKVERLKRLREDGSVAPPATSRYSPEAVRAFKMKLRPEQLTAIAEMDDAELIPHVMKQMPGASDEDVKMAIGVLRS